MEPILKWAGGKRQLLPVLEKIILPELNGKNRYFEPFAGGGSVALSFEYKKTTINDLNEELINVYKTIKSNPEEVILKLKYHQQRHCKDYYYLIRSLDRNSKKYSKLSNAERAARIIYLNKTCYNGLFRVNKKGEFNVPLGRSASKKTDIVCEEKIRLLSKFLNFKDVVISQGSFEDSVRNAKKGDVIYFDPPYDYEDDGFIAYHKNGFSKDNLQNLAELCNKLIEKGCIVVVSNNDTKFVRECFKSEYYTVYEVEARRYINCNGKERRKAEEVIIYGKK